MNKLKIRFGFWIIHHGHNTIYQYRWDWGPFGLTEDLRIQGTIVRVYFGTFQLYKLEF